MIFVIIHPRLAGRTVAPDVSLSHEGYSIAMPVKKGVHALNFGKKRSIFPTTGDRGAQSPGPQFINLPQFGNMRPPPDAVALQSKPSKVEM
ncbi:hypothetical protein [uncultured Martelella sp.]|uniref:hypothetical protein n=1 Tax=uncultured Martelella sp. TaxID=392331 RepID=UPI0029C8DCD0|nr:hypothetical protein [uncultured Martelella sp.]